MTKVKICGITRVDDAMAAIRWGADAIGLVFYERSPRYVDDLERAKDIALAAGPFATVVGLFVNATADRVAEVLDRVPIRLLQFHGDEDDERCADFGRPYMKALRMHDDMDAAAAMAAYPKAVGFLLDTYRAGTPGGTGEVFDWSRVPAKPPRPVVLAGGLTPSNVAAAIRQARPYGVDVSGGVEQSPGVKDDNKMRNFVAEAKREL